MAKSPKITEAEETFVYYIAIAAGYWGRGETTEKAIGALKRAGGSTKTMLLYRFDTPAGKDRPYVDDSGNTCYFGERRLVAATKAGAILDPTTIAH